MATSQYLRTTKPLTAEMIAVLIILRDSPSAMMQKEIERFIGPKGRRVSIADAVDYLEDPKVEFIAREQPAPKTARFIITSEGTRAIGAHIVKAIRTLKERILRMETPHQRDKSVIEPEQVDPFRHLLKQLEAGRFSRPRGVERPDDEDADEGGPEDEGPVHSETARPSRALETAKRERARNGGETQPADDENEGLSELEDSDEGGSAEDEPDSKPPAKLGTKTNRVPRGVKPASGRGRQPATV